MARGGHGELFTRHEGSQLLGCILRVRKKTQPNIGARGEDLQKSPQVRWNPPLSIIDNYCPIDYHLEWHSSHGAHTSCRLTALSSLLLTSDDTCPSRTL